MTNHNPYSDAGSSGSTVTAPNGGKIDTAKQDASAVAGTAKQGAADVAQETVQQAKVVTGVAVDHARTLLSDSATQLRGHADEQAQRAAGGLDQVATKGQALLSGRPEEAGELRDYAQELGDRAQQLADRLRSGGFDGIVADTGRFARRRPGLFLAGAAAAGFFVGRMVKAQRSDSSGNGQDQGLRTLSRGAGQADYPYPQANYPIDPQAAYPTDPQAGYRSGPDVPLLPDATTPPAVDARPSVGTATHASSSPAAPRENW